MTDKRDERIERVLGEMWQETCEKGGSVEFKIKSGSMSPVIKEGDVVKVTKIVPARINTGDIVAFLNGENVIVHRIIGKIRVNDQYIFRQRGDTNSPAGEITAKNLIGKVSAIKKGERELSLETPWYNIANLVLGWRLRFREYLDRIHPGFLSAFLHHSLRPLWRLSRKILLWRL